MTTYQPIDSNDEWIVDDFGTVVGVRARIDGKNSIDKNFVFSEVNPVNGGVRFRQRIIRPSDLSMSIDLSKIDMPSVPADLTTTVGPSVLANNATERTALAAVLTKSYSLSGAPGLVVANKYLGVAGHAMLVAGEGNGVWIAGGWKESTRTYYQQAFCEFETDSQDVAIVLRTQYGMGPGFILVDGQPVGSDAIQVGGNGSLIYQWVRLTFSTSKVRRISYQLQSVAEIRVLPGCSIWKPEEKPYRWKVFGDSLLRTTVGPGETTPFSGQPWQCTSIEARLCRIIGAPLPAVSAQPGTGFVQTTGTDGNYLQRLQNEPASTSIGCVWFWGSTNDFGVDIAAYKLQVKSCIDVALSMFPSAVVIVTGTLDGFTLGGATNSALYSAALLDVCSQYVKSQVIFVPLSASQRTDDGYIYGTGKVGATTGDGNADIYCGTATSGTDRHFNLAAVKYMAQRLALDFKGALEAA